MTLYEAVKLHRELWRWLAETGNKYKFKWPGWSNIDIQIKNRCFMCEYVKENCNRFTCVMCPLKWDENGVYGDLCGIENGLHVLWSSQQALEERKKYAAIIAELPLKEEYQEQYDKEAADEE